MTRHIQDISQTAGKGFISQSRAFDARRWVIRSLRSNCQKRDTSKISCIKGRGWCEEEGSKKKLKNSNRRPGAVPVPTFEQNTIKSKTSYLQPPPQSSLNYLISTNDM